MAAITLEQLRWHKFPVLDEGFVCLVDAMGDDAAVVQAARVSYGAGTKTVSDDRTLIRYLMRHGHWTPFEMAEIKLLVRVPADSWRQWIRHRTASVNEYSMRFSVAIDAAQRTDPTQWRTQSKSNKQGSSEFLPGSIGRQLSEDEAKLQAEARRIYELRLEQGVAREQARKDLPLSTYTEAYWKCDLRNVLNFLSLRMDSHAQLEIRTYANVIGEQIVAPLFPCVWEAFNDYDHRRGALLLSRLEQTVLEALISRHRSGMDVTDETFYGVLKTDATHLGWEIDPAKSCRERDECLAKMKRLGIVVD